MKILNRKIHNKTVICDCGTELEYSNEDIITGQFGCAYIVCPECQSSIWLENEEGKTLTINNIEYPKDFSKYGDGNILFDYEIQMLINDCLKVLDSSNENYGVYSLSAIGDSMVFVTKHDDEYHVYVCKNYEETVIPK